LNHGEQGTKGKEQGKEEKEEGQAQSAAQEVTADVVRNRCPQVMAWGIFFPLPASPKYDIDRTGAGWVKGNTGRNKLANLIGLGIIPLIFI
jgi:hypothetical protein